MVKKKNISKRSKSRLDGKREVVNKWLKSSFVYASNICDNLYGLTKGEFSLSGTVHGLDNPNSILYEIDDICRSLCTTGEIDELFNVLTVLYATKKGIAFNFNTKGELVSHDETDDETFNVLYDITMATKGRDYHFKDVHELYNTVTKINTDDYLSLYPAFIDSVRHRCSALNGGTVAFPQYFISKTIGDIVRQHNCHSLYNPFSGAGGLLLGLDSSIEYTGQESYGIYSIFSRVIADAHGIDDAKFLIGDPMTNWPKDNYDAVIFNLPTNCYFDDYNNYIEKGEANADLHKAVFRKILRKRTATKVAIGLVRYPFIRSFDFKNLRQQFFDEGILESVICLPEKDVFADSKVKTAIVVLDFENKHDNVNFYRGEYAVTHNHSAYSTMYSNGYNIIDETPLFFKATAGKEQLKLFNWQYIAALYANPIKCKEGEHETCLNEVATIIPAVKPYAVNGYVVGYDCYNTQFFDIACAQHKFEFKNTGFSFATEVSGPCILFRVNTDGKIGACIIRDGETVVYDHYNVYALKPDLSKISLEYLAYSLVSCKEFQNYLTDCIEYNSDDRVMENVIMYSKLPINPDLRAQSDFVNQLLKKHLITRNRIYNIIWASAIWSPDFKGKYIEDERSHYIKTLAQFGISVISKPLTASQLEDELTRHIDECTSSSEKADAVFLDASINLGLKAKDDEEFDGLDYAIELKDKYEKKRIPFYLFTGKSIEEITRARIKKRRLEYFLNRYFNTSADEALESLCIQFQEEMEAIGSRESEMRNKYSNVFKAADRYNQGDVQRILTEALDEEFSTELSLRFTEDKFNKLRQIAEGLLKDLSDKGIIPDLLFGAQVGYLADGNYDDRDYKARFYHADIKLMPDTLGKAFKYFHEIVAGGSHKAYGSKKILNVVDYVSKESKNSDLYKSVLYILMDVLIWYDRILDIAETAPDSIIGKFRTITRGKPITGKVEEDENGNLICCHTLLLTDRYSTVRAGDTVQINESRAYNKPTENIWLCAYADKYFVVRHEE